MTSNKEIHNQEVLSRLKSALEKWGLTQRDLASITGRHESEISRWLSGRSGISASSQLILERALGEALSADSSFKPERRTLHVGIVGTGSIAGRFTSESRVVPGVSVVAAYNPDQVQLHDFCTANSIPTACASYERMLELVDAVYVASPVWTHFSYASEALSAGRHVLCEMPFVQTRSEAEDLFRMAKRSGLVLMPALKTAYCPSFLELLSVVRSGVIGEVVDVSATVTTLLPSTLELEYSNERMMENASYPILAFLKMLGSKWHRYRAFVRRDGAKPQFVHLALEYDNAMASCKVGVGVKSEGCLVVSGTEGYVYVPAPWWKTDYFEVRFENQADNKKYFFPYEESGLRYEIQAFAGKINRTDDREYLSKDDLIRLVDCQNMFIPSMQGQ